MPSRAADLRSRSGAAAKRSRGWPPPRSSSSVSAASRRIPGIHAAEREPERHHADPRHQRVQHDSEGGRPLLRTWLCLSVTGRPATSAHARFARPPSARTQRGRDPYRRPSQALAPVGVSSFCNPEKARAEGARGGGDAAQRNARQAAMGDLLQGDRGRPWPPRSSLASASDPDRFGAFSRRPRWVVAFGAVSSHGASVGSDRSPGYCRRSVLDTYFRQCPRATSEGDARCRKPAFAATNPVELRHAALSPVRS